MDCCSQENCATRIDYLHHRQFWYPLACLKVWAESQRTRKIWIDFGSWDAVNVRSEPPESKIQMLADNNFSKELEVH